MQGIVWILETTVRISLYPLFGFYNYSLVLTGCNQKSPIIFWDLKLFILLGMHFTSTQTKLFQFFFHTNNAVVAAVHNLRSGRLFANVKKFT